jgi:hypothetical protein
MANDRFILKVEEKLLELLDTSMAPDVVLQHLMSDKDKQEEPKPLVDPKVVFVAQELFKKWAREL